ncbi:MAG: hypothetical protein ACLGIZ_03470 [Acidimicrobiia bacterium]
MATDQTDSELDQIQDRVDAIRGRLADNPGLDMVDDDDVPAYFEDGDIPPDGVTSEEAARRDDADDHQAHAPG